MQAPSVQCFPRLREEEEIARFVLEVRIARRDREVSRPTVVPRDSVAVVVDDGRIAVAVGDVARGVDSCPKRWQSVVIGSRRGHSDSRDGGGTVGGCVAEELGVSGQSAERFGSVADTSEPVAVDVKEVVHRQIVATMLGGRSPALRALG
jgi:hypothetical protein